MPKLSSCVTAEIAILLMVAALTPVLAHHAFSAEFDSTKPVKLRGTVKQMEWINPHAWVHVDVKGPDGKVETWMIEAGTPNTLLRRGFTKNSLAVGTEILVDGYQSKDGSLRANGRDVTFSDGRKLFIGTAGTGAPGEEKKPGGERK
jgi:hypothetical protein